MTTDPIKFADLHCHPNLKTFGHSFSEKSLKTKKKSSLWYTFPPTWFSKAFNAITGMTRFRQADFTTMTRAHVRIVMISLYPFEKGFFINGFLNGPLSAKFANLITGIGFKRIRFIQKHCDYFSDLENEYRFLLDSVKEKKVDGLLRRWRFVDSFSSLEHLLEDPNSVAIITTIEGAHIFNSGLEAYGKVTREEEVLGNIAKVKKWKFPPLFITLAHNFNNDLCGHARSLERLGPLVDQSENLYNGFSALGLKVVKALLVEGDKPIYIDIKHMSLKSRKAYFWMIENEFDNKFPVIVSHGAVTGLDFNGQSHGSIDPNLFSNDAINFFDEEIIGIAKTEGLFALQMDGNRLANRKIIKKSIFKIDAEEAVKASAIIIWRQIQHVAEVLDKAQLFAWSTACIGSDFDGTINPLNGFWTAAELPLLREALLVEARFFINSDRHNDMELAKNKSISAEDIIENYIYNNTVTFLKKFY